jgi:Ca2+-binding EF-hand superfamily protein
MRKFYPAVLATGLIAISTAAFAAFGDYDSDGDGALNGEEFIAAYPDLTGEDFVKVDVNADGAITEDELVAAVEAGLLPAE